METSDLCPVLEVGIDYFTVTGSRGGTGSSLRAFGSHVVEELVHHGAKKTTYRSQGYNGNAAEGAAYGSRHDGSILRLSGPTANEYWEQAFTLSENVTRMDLQVTVKPSIGAAGMLRRHWASLKKRGRTLGRQPQYKMVVGNDGPQTLMLGARSSDRYGRIYDKWLECGLAEYRGALRYELELKKDAAAKMAALLDCSVHQRPQIDAAVSEFVDIRVGSKSPWRPVTEVCGPTCICGRPRTFGCIDLDLRTTAPTDGSSSNRSVSASKQLLFLENCVRPTIQRLLGAGLSVEVHNALGLPMPFESGVLGTTGENKNLEFFGGGPTC